ncbi:hypothetical protein J3Q64DRAFT_1693272 [Phycomyces blakesleeanus]|uniref:MULE transposase domain-containing protein n=2 Tax=Phycomyces blakesleeanus TaxID=4837 RepID=A0A167K484_PHYB8|nr:hypothetical protein PHYBLDRAFT_63758 [Phycomyces blakesleeanus NRRL 1555(-)]OAD67248.1 hypothetical protein PHYBLDRAFT_63758 [Phycomyces blakesleeanus NRRL 1555(-)]|eukprot:XP_018285288.1 hypothetical protein PHYBLDRAFT_63758 [Phycomyces blakesleeanus NRRL 1555(-)]
MIDCSSAEIRAIGKVFRNEVDLILRHWHIKRAWEVNIKVVNSTQDSNIACNIIQAALNNMMYASTSVAFNNLYNSFLEKCKDYETFIAYFEKMGIPKKQLWSKAWRQLVTFHMNNFIESYHNQLKTFYF